MLSLSPLRGVRYAKFFLIQQFYWYRYFYILYVYGYGIGYLTGAVLEHLTGLLIQISMTDIIYMGAYKLVSVWSNVAKVLSVWGHIVVWLLVVPDRARDIDTYCTVLKLCVENWNWDNPIQNPNLGWAPVLALHVWEYRCMDVGQLLPPFSS